MHSALFIGYHSFTIILRHSLIAKSLLPTTLRASVDREKSSSGRILKVKVWSLADFDITKKRDPHKLALRTPVGRVQAQCLRMTREKARSCNCWKQRNYIPVLVLSKSRIVSRICLIRLVTLDDDYTIQLSARFKLPVTSRQTPSHTPSTSFPTEDPTSTCRGLNRFHSTSQKCWCEVRQVE
jgi:hypothetical protein